MIIKIKKLTVCILAVMFCMFTFVSCDKEYKAPFSVTLFSQEGSDITVEDYSSETILDLINSGKWINDTPNCLCDYVFKIGGDTIRYHASCGTFYNEDSKKAMTLSESDKSKINSVLESLFGK